MPDVMSEDPLDHPTAGVDPGAIPLGATKLLLEVVDRPSVEEALDDAERRVESFGQRSAAEHVFEVVVAGTVVSSVRE
jgi:hypothetical protein